MIQFVRSLFGLNKSSSNRKVAGAGLSYDQQEVEYIKDSNNRLAALVQLQKRYKNTPHAEKIKLVYEKTKKIQWFLVSKKRVHELELFHIQNTDHFISTFTLIVDVYERHQEISYQNSVAEPIVKEVPVQQVAVAAEKTGSNGSRQKGELFEIAERVKNRSRQSTTLYTEEPTAPVPTLAIPEVSINTIAKVFYHKEEAPGKQTSFEISFVSTQEEKEAFQQYISSRLGIQEVHYVGNARINLLDNKGNIQKEMAPVLYLRNYLYALTLHDYRIFPVKINRATS
ncbi:hypothetical protein GXP67_27810 [Rhodocytophaga rosea]|uniref:Uncharacterized protein n=1 Tax=Rhodocytophaga rosea TaxID=2704465 RepID=A0A6C0GRR0_9BACT|nr:hypothetical protein [Rhodocytophaga rosea]QHT70180.1 hypothetical protein GXP67_27810 [Rhodocytophaga rosea]